MRGPRTARNGQGARLKPGILAVDIGGSGLKAAVLDERGTMRSERVRIETPQPCPPDLLVASVAAMVQPLPAYDRISIGFPGVIRNRKVLTAPHLDTELWAGFALADALSKKLGGYPSKIVNDAEMQGLALIRGKGLELAITLGTGVGTALFRDGEMMPHMELAHHPLRDDKTYDEVLGNAAYEKSGRKRWNKHLRKALKFVDVLLHPDHIIIGGGNARHVDSEDLPATVSIGSNAAGIEGGAALWRATDKRARR
ncbi:ROK family protein [Hydrocarboniphaga sp.]|uniref:ROK family protein n=1 Tax=Hydrocarboniphaga sp. TaxID=2033016 RepID=UPI003D0C36C6